MKNKNKSWFTYILLCDGKTFYVGITDSLEERLQEHKEEKSFYTSQFSDIKLVYFEKYSSKILAAKREKQIKGWRREKKIILIKGEL